MFAGFSAFMLSKMGVYHKYFQNARENFRFSAKKSRPVRMNRPGFLPANLFYQPLSDFKAVKTEV